MVTRSAHGAPIPAPRIAEVTNPRGGGSIVDSYHDDCDVPMPYCPPNHKIVRELLEKLQKESSKANLAEHLCCMYGAKTLPHRCNQLEEFCISCP